MILRVLPWEKCHLFAFRKQRNRMKLISDNIWHMEVPGLLWNRCNSCNTTELPVDGANVVKVIKAGFFISGHMHVSMKYSEYTIICQSTMYNQLTLSSNKSHLYRGSHFPHEFKYMVFLENNQRRQIVLHSSEGCFNNLACIHHSPVFTLFEWTKH